MTEVGKIDGAQNEQGLTSPPTDRTTPLNITTCIKEARSHHVPITQRNWAGILHDFGYENVETGFWPGKQILDVGAGIKDDYVETVFPGAKVCAIDPEYGDGGRIESFKIPKWAAHEARPGTAQDIPYDDNTFDIVWSSHAVTQHIYPAEQNVALLEMIRVMKSNGEIRMTPPFQFFGRTTELLAEMGFNIEEITREDFLPVTRITLNQEKQGEKDAIYQKLKVELEKRKQDMSTS